MVNRAARHCTSVRPVFDVPRRPWRHSANASVLLMPSVTSPIRACLNLPLLMEMMKGCPPLAMAVEPEIRDGSTVSVHELSPSTPTLPALQA